MLPGIEQRVDLRVCPLFRVGGVVGWVGVCGAHTMGSRSPARAFVVFRVTRP